MSDFRFERDPEGVAMVLNGPGVAAFLTSTAKAARERIQRHAPRGFMNYWKSVRYVPARLDGFELVAAVGVDSPVWHLPEYGTANYPARSPIRRGVTDVGIRLDTMGNR